MPGKVHSPHVSEEDTDRDFPSPSVDVPDSTDIWIVKGMMQFYYLPVH